jgi:hypothetical protein
MVSYGSAKAEAHGVRVPGGVLRRASRAALLAGGTTFVPIAAVIARSLSAPAWAAYSPVFFALALIAVAAVVGPPSNRRGRRVAPSAERDLSASS